MILTLKNAIRAVSVVLTLMPWCPSFASLVICIYYNNQIYLGSDSLVHGQGGEKDFNTPKIFQIADTCCVSITGNYGSTFRDTKTASIVLQIILPLELEKICRDLNSTHQPLEYKINTVIQQFGLKYVDCFRKLLSIGEDPRKIEDTRICFVGYDPLTKSFFQKSCLFRGTNQAALETRFERNSTSSEPYFSFQGEDHFLTALLTSSDDMFMKLRSDAFKRTMSQLVRFDSFVSDDSVANLMLEMFSLHKTNAASTGSDKGFIGEPYVIYKITSEQTSKIR